MQPTEKKKRRNPHVNNIISKVIECLRTAAHPLTLAEIEKAINVSLSQKEDLLTIIKDNRKINYDDAQERFALNRLYDIFDRETLVDVLKKYPRGIPENQDLFDCYRGVEKDISNLKIQGYVRYIYNAEKDKKFNVLFYKNPDDTAERFSTPVSGFVKDIWKAIPPTDAQARQKMLEELRKKN
jgi:TFIIE beta subunit core domain